MSFWSTFASFSALLTIEVIKKTSRKLCTCLFLLVRKKNITLIFDQFGDEKKIVNNLCQNKSFCQAQIYGAIFVWNLNSVFLFDFLFSDLQLNVIYLQTICIFFFVSWLDSDEWTTHKIVVDSVLKWLTSKKPFF